VSFARGDELLRLCISDHDPAAAGDQPAAWILSRRFLAIVRDELPPGDPAPELLTRRLLAVFDRYAPPGGLRVAGEEGVAVF